MDYAQNAIKIEVLKIIISNKIDENPEVSDEW
jgi:hypothetical protein